MMANVAKNSPTDALCNDMQRQLTMANSTDSVSIILLPF